MISKSVKNNAIKFATEIKLLEKKYNLFLTGGRIGEIHIISQQGDSIIILDDIKIKETEIECKK